jgi:hypothetical protein
MSFILIIGVVVVAILLSIFLPTPPECGPELKPMYRNKFPRK